MVENTNRALVPSRLGIPLQQLDMAFPSAKFAISWCWQVPCPSSSWGAAPCPPMGALCEIPGSGNMGLSGVQPVLELVLGPQPPLVVQPTSTVSTLCSLAFFTGFCASSPCSSRPVSCDLALLAQGCALSLGMRFFLDQLPKPVLTMLTQEIFWSRYAGFPC